MKAVPYGDKEAEAFCEGLESLDGDSYEYLVGCWIDVQAVGELGGTGEGRGTWTFSIDGEDVTLTGKDLLDFAGEQMSVPTGFWILEDLHFEAAMIPVLEAGDHGGATVHQVAETSFQRICSMLAVRTLGSPDPFAVPKDGGGENDVVH